MKFRNCIMTALLTLALFVGTIPASAGNYTLQSGEITTHFIGLQSSEDAEGISLAPSVQTRGNPIPAQTIENHTYVSYTANVRHIYAREHLPYIIGYPDSSVQPEREMSRAEAAMVFHRMFWWTRDSSEFNRDKLFTRETFDDVERADWFYEAVKTLYNAGIVRGFGGSFNPNDSVSREELATMAARFEGLRITDAQSMFSDVERGNWSTPYIHASANRGWIVGYPDGTFRPNNSISRAEVVTLINRVLERTLLLQDVPSGINPYTDIVSTHWAFGDIIEATIRHCFIDWHGTAFNDGRINVIIERFVDQDGNEIAETVIRDGEPERHPREFEGYSYHGYIAEIVHHYETYVGRAFPEVAKTVDRTTASVGDLITYTITATNGYRATADWRNVVLTDEIDPRLTFEFGSVLVNGHSVPFSYVNRILTVELGDIAPEESVVVNFSAIVNSNAVGQTIRNTAVAQGENGSGSDTSEDVQVDNGNSFGQVRKNADRASARVGDTITYTITATNAGVATGDWRNVVVSDEIPEHLEFIDGSVTVNGSTAKVNSNFNAATRTLVVRLGNIAPSETVTVTFRTRVLDGAQGLFIMNTAVVTGDDTAPITAPDRGVEIDAGDPRPFASKTASHNEIKVGERVTYTITLRNDTTATAPWRNVVVNDVIPAGFAFVNGSVMVNGMSHPHGVAGQAIRVPVGDILLGQTVTITLQATALESGMGQRWYNVASISSDNDPNRQVTDGGTLIPKEKINAPTPSAGGGDITVTATKATGLASVRPGERITYTITAQNPAGNDHTWYNVILTDLLNTSQVAFISGTVTIDSIPANAQQHSYVNRLLTVNLGDLAPGQLAVVRFQVLVKPDAQDTTIHNTATITGSFTRGGARDRTVRVSERVPVPGGGATPITAIHRALFRGYPDGTWRPQENINREEAVAVFHRILVRPAPGTAQLPPDVGGHYFAAEAVRYFLGTGAISLTGGNFNPHAPITMRDFNRLSVAVGGGQLLPNLDQPITRIAAAGLIADMQGRSHNPNTNGLPFRTFSDVPVGSANFGLVTEMSNDHGHFWDIHGNEIWEAL